VRPYNFLIDNLFAWWAHTQVRPYFLIDNLFAWWAHTQVRPYNFLIDVRFSFGLLLVAK
jgi:hypothetical protein